MPTLHFDVSAQNYRCLRKVSHFSSKIGMWPRLRILRISYMTTLYFDVLAQNYSCLRIVSYFSRKIGIARYSTGCRFRGSTIRRVCIMASLPQTTAVCERFHILAVKQGLGKIPLVADFEDQLYGDFAFCRLGPKIQMFAKNFTFQQ